MMLALLAAAAVSAAPTPSAAAGPPAAVQKGIQEQWTASDGAPLSTTLTGWAQRAGWTVVWETDDDFRLAAGATLDGDFQTAAGGLIEAFSHARPRLRAIFYAGNRVLRVWTERNEP
jgi:type IV pili sensor histidine kinase/response regulator